MSREPQEHHIGRLEELPPGTHRVVRVANRELGVFNIDGRVHAIPNLCPHQRGPLCAGSVSGTIDCGPHTDWRLAWIWEGEVVTLSVALPRVPRPHRQMRRLRGHPVCERTTCA